MTMTALLKEARTLKPRQRVALVNKLIALDLAEDAPEVDETEMVRRINDVKLGRVKLLDARETLREARKIAGLAGEPLRLKSSRR